MTEWSAGIMPDKTNSIGKCEQMEKVRIMVTGGSGFLGSRVIDLLAKKGVYDVVAVVSGRRNISLQGGVRAKKADLLSDSECEELIASEKPDILMHLAWNTSAPEYRGASTNMQWLSVSLRLLQSFVKHEGKCFMFAGTSSEYEYDAGKAQETAQAQRMSMYGECKRAFSSVMGNYCSRNGVRYVDARFFTIYGEDDPHYFAAIPQAVFDLLQNKPIVCKAPNTVRDYIHVEDAARAAVMIMESDYCGAVNVGSGKPHMMRDVFHLIAKTLGKEQLLSFENEDRCDLILVADTSVLRDKIGFNPIHDFENGMRETIRWWEAKNNASVDEKG